MQNKRHEALLSLGANLGKPVETLRAALADLAALNGVEEVRASGFYGTSPVDSSGPDYVNAAAVLKTRLSSLELLDVMQAIEKKHGRVRPVGVHNAPRMLDLDLLTFDDEMRETSHLTLPHPRMLERLFVLVPLAELLPDWKSPAGESIGDLIEKIRANDPSQHILRLKV